MDYFITSSQTYPGPCRFPVVQLWKRLKHLLQVLKLIFFLSFSCEKVETPLWRSLINLTFKRQPDKMVRPNQTARRQIADELLSVLDHFVGLALKGLKEDE